MRGGRGGGESQKENWKSSEEDYPPGEVQMSESQKENWKSSQLAQIGSSLRGYESQKENWKSRGRLGVWIPRLRISKRELKEKI